jgi:hypothetical protein
MLAALHLEAAGKTGRSKEEAIKATAIVPIDCRNDSTGEWMWRR